VQATIPGLELQRGAANSLAQRWGTPTLALSNATRFQTPARVARAVEPVATAPDVRVVVAPAGRRCDIDVAYRFAAPD
jgi:hypothetical protein